MECAYYYCAILNSCSVQYYLEVLTPRAIRANLLFAMGDGLTSPAVKKIFPFGKTEVRFTAGNLPRVKRRGMVKKNKTWLRVIVKNKTFCFMTHFDQRLSKFRVF